MWVFPFILTRIHIGAIHLSDSLVTLLLVGVSHKAVAFNIASEYLRVTSFMTNLIAPGEASKA